ncbi:WD40-repeat-containing domain protein [Mycena albidolilacea]|uniref:WD40-repeat-containing domain protein n=1 Tax=Mycena albidolilacea TaxID=1033008 RepID=A0AAD7E6X3_9AGAR|nr:WD40-repeat-containing domain protein [Mycena albidolilacea]
MAFFNSSTSNAATTAAVEKDIEMGDPPTDSISCMAFSSQADYLAVRIYEAMYQHEGPVLSVCWNKEGSKIFSGGADNAGRMFDVATGQATQVAQHDAPIKVVKWYWDLRTPAPVATVQLPERCYSVDVQYPLMVVGTAERHIQIFNLTNPTTPYKTMLSPLKWQTRVVSCFTASTNSGFAVGSVEGRVAIQYVEDKDSGNNFSFKCHRRDSTPTSKTLPSYLLSRHLVPSSFEAAPGPISTTTFNRNGSIFAYAVSYDWSKGHSGMTPGHPNKLMLHACKEDEVKKRPRKV